jgi:CMP-N-acetylneuraminic acid synthetase
MRPKELSADNSSTIDVLLHAMDWLEKKEGYLFDILVLLHATTPLRIVEDIDNCIELLMKKDADNVFSVCKAHRNPYFNMVEVNKNGTVKLVKKGFFVTRQSAPQVFDMNSSIYIWWKDVLQKKKGIFLNRSTIYVMPKERSIDIDDNLDFKVAELFCIN